MAVNGGRGSNPMTLIKFENPQIKNYIKYWENECRTSSFSLLLDQSQHTTQQAVIKSNKDSLKYLDDQGIKQKIWYLKTMNIWYTSQTIKCFLVFFFSLAKTKPKRFMNDIIWRREVCGCGKCNLDTIYYCGPLFNRPDW